MSLKHLRVDDFLYSGDASAMNAIKILPGFSKIMEFIAANSVEKFYRIIYTSSNLKLTAKNAPKVYKIYSDACEMFELEKMPEIFIERNYSYRTQVFGIENPIIIVSTPLLENLSDEMLACYLAADIAGIKAGHGIMSFVDTLFNNFGALIPVPREVYAYPMNQWNKQKYYTYDRARLLMSENFELVSKLIGIDETTDGILAATPLEERLEQGKEFLDLSGNKALAKSFLTVYSGIPWNSSRLIDLYNWHESGEFHRIIQNYSDEVSVL